MPLPQSLLSALDALAFNIPLKTLTAATERIGSGYRDGHSTHALRFDDLTALAYGITRLPATYAATEAAFGELQLTLPEFSPTSHLDLGAGCGSAALVARDFFPDLETQHLVERDEAMISLGRRLIAESDGPPVTWITGDFSRVPTLPPADLVTLSYALVEVAPESRLPLLAQAWAACRGVLVLVEPGTTPGFSSILQARRELVAAGAHVLAPCPHGGTCPMEGTTSWCHFAARLPRSRRHVALKGGTLGYEDEKYSYAVFSREPAEYPVEARITRPTKVDKASVEMELCVTEGLVPLKITRHEKALWSRARKARWGDRHPE